MFATHSQISRKPYDFKVDIFSLGLILLELFIPFGTQMERLKTIQDAKRQIFPHSFSQNFPKEVILISEDSDKNLMIEKQAKVCSVFIEYIFLKNDNFYAKNINTHKTLLKPARSSLLAYDIESPRATYFYTEVCFLKQF